eukprot:49459_1
MVLFGFTPLDTWAISDSTTYTTMTIQSICLFLTLILILIRAYYIYKEWDKFQSNWKFQLEASLPLTQLLMMIFSFIYMFFHLWNYIYLYNSSNPLDCTIWFSILGICFASTRILLISFLMLRSSLSFKNTFCALSPKISIIMITITVIINITSIVMIDNDSVAFNPIPDKGVCWRSQGEIAAVWSTVLHLGNSIISIMALAIFYWKSSSVKKLIESLTNDNKMNNDLIELDNSFKKHIKLGIITVAGTILIFFVQEILTVLLGISFALDQTINNILTFIMFKPHEIVY